MLIGETFESRERRKKEKEDLLGQWHSWFAWRPVFVETVKVGNKEKLNWKWGITVERRGQWIFFDKGARRDHGFATGEPGSAWVWEYRIRKDRP